MAFAITARVICLVLALVCFALAGLLTVARPGAGAPPLPGAPGGLLAAGLALLVLALLLG